jgi:hypothetical protein
MPSISGATLSLSGSAWANVTLDVTYTATFSSVERFLAANGLIFEERIQIIGDDPGELSDVTLHTFQSQVIPVSAGSGDLAVNRSRSLTVAGGTLNEDPGGTGIPFPIPNSDEIFARIEVAYVGLNAGPARTDSPVRTITVV